MNQITLKNKLTVIFFAAIAFGIFYVGSIAYKSGRYIEHADPFTLFILSSLGAAVGMSTYGWIAFTLINLILRPLKGKGKSILEFLLYVGFGILADYLIMIANGPLVGLYLPYSTIAAILGYITLKTVQRIYKFYY
ncbi:hypothetical protein C1X05_15980 [Laceyella sacchari]|uniref:Uncharacterized protein n=1 Tax=Laceyella tengchongensis TaxID=574699 RepID=A0AA45WQM7_9BACL|nr:hypothetical protein [Laceyella tengchongensis]AUS10183.1 hypothetical protein C1X05_15980 [Laceyella sacchari]SMP26748.1 hypothetical protein SAMN06265361_105194 [Laceyella tengchongensis]